MASSSTPNQAATNRAGEHGAGFRGRYPDAPSAADRELLEGEPRAQGRDQLRALLSLLWRRKWLLLGGLVLGTLIAAAIGLLLPLKYDAVSSVQIDQQATRVLQGEDNDQAGGYMDVDRTLRTQMDVLNSRTVASRVARSEHLLDDNRFLVRMGLAPAKLPSGRDAARGREQLVMAVLRGNMATDLPRDSRVANIRFRSPDAPLAAQIANAFAQQFVINNLERRTSGTGYARDYLQSQLEQSRARLEASERQLNAYARQANLIDTSTPSSNGGGMSARSTTTAALVNLNDAFAAATATRIQAEQHYNVARAGSAESIPEVLSNPAVQDLLKQRATRASTLAELQKTRREGFPAVIQAQAQLDEINRQIATVAGRIRDSLREQYTAAAAQEQALGQQVSGLKTATLSEQDRSVQYNILRRNVDTNRSLYDGLLQRYRELSAIAGIGTNNISVVDVAETPLSPSSPNVPMLLVIGAVLGLAAAFGAALVTERLDATLHAAGDMERVLGAPVLGTVPLFGNRRTFVQEALAGGSGAEAYSSLLVSLSFSTAAGFPKSLLVTSSQANEGKTSTALLVAHALAKRNYTVLLVDADLRRSSLGRYLGLTNTRGFSDLLTSAAPVEQLVSPSDQAGLALMSAGTIVASPAELLRADLLDQALAEMNRRYDYVVIDAPPVLGLADALALSSATSATLVVVEANRTSRNHLANAIKRLRSVGAPIVGGVLNKLPRSAAEAEYGADYLSYGSAA